MIGLTTNVEDEMHDDAASTAAGNRTTGLPDQDPGGWTSVAGPLGGLASDLDVTVGAAGLTVTMVGLAYATGAALLSAVLGGRPIRQVLG